MAERRFYQAMRALRGLMPREARLLGLGPAPEAMSFQPMIPLAGIAGWRFLQRTQASAAGRLREGPRVSSDVAYFAEKIGAVTTAADLVADRRLLKVALGAFGLEGEIDKKAFIRKVLEEGTTARRLANRLTDQASAGSPTPSASAIPAARTPATPASPRRSSPPTRPAPSRSRSARADNDMRLAMNFRREIAELAAQGEDGASWYTVLGSKPLRQVFEKAFGLPKQFAQIDIDRQRDILPTRPTGCSATTRWPPSDPAAMEKVIDPLPRPRPDRGRPERQQPRLAGALVPAEQFRLRLERAS